jgi:ribonuclease VapC
MMFVDASAIVAILTREPEADALADALDGARSVRTVPITDKDAQRALDAFSRYGRGRGHPAQLNLGDCFAYAVARQHRTSLLFKGDDFAKTDIEAAMTLG